MRNPFKRKYVIYLVDSETGGRVPHARRRSMSEAHRLAESLNLDMYFQDREANRYGDALYFMVGKA